MSNNKFLLPWKMSKGGAFDYGVDNCEGGLVMGDTTYYPVAPDEEEMAFIVRAVNSHDLLVESVKQLLGCMSLAGWEGDATAIKARAALAAAEAK